MSCFHVKKHIQTVDQKQQPLERYFKPKNVTKKSINPAKLERPEELDLMRTGEGGPNQPPPGEGGPNQPAPCRDRINAGEKFRYNLDLCLDHERK